MYQIYKLSWLSGCLRYVGCSKNAVERIYQHLKPGGRFVHLLALHGMPEILILDRAETMEHAAACETWHIADQCSAVPWLGGMNKRKSGGYSHPRCGSASVEISPATGPAPAPAPAPVSLSWSDWVKSAPATVVWPELSNVEIERLKLARRKRIAMSLFNFV